MMYFTFQTLVREKFFGNRASFKIGARVVGGPLDPIREGGSHRHLSIALSMRDVLHDADEDEAMKKIRIENVKMGRVSHTSLSWLCYWCAACLIY